MFALILDHRPDYLGHTPKSGSLLRLPLGAATYLDFLIEHIASVLGRGAPEVYVLPSFESGRNGADRRLVSRRAEVGLIAASDLDAVVGNCEQTDSWLIIDAGRWPVHEVDLAWLLRDREDYRGATHLIAVGADSDPVRECVDRDPNGQVRRVQRVYAHMSWPEIANQCTFCSWVPARALGGVRFTTLDELRTALAARGVLSRDVPLKIDVADLNSVEGARQLSERVIVRDVKRNGQTGLAHREPSTLVGRDCRIDASVRLVGPVILHDGVTLEPGVTIVGPATVGAGSQVRRNALVAQSTLAPETQVAAGAVVRNRVGSNGVEHPEPPAQSSAGFAADVPATPWVRMNGHGYPRIRPITPHAVPGPGRRVHFTLKRLLDVAVSLVGLVVLAPLMLVAALLIKLDSHGPVFFVHRRERKDGKNFPCLKFRTMTADAHNQQRRLYQHNAVDGPQFKLRQDPRVTRIGRWLRGTNIDELPQLINVLVGHMSLVGPRPSPFRENQTCITWRQGRLSVRPGITGLWQICRSTNRSEGGFQEWVLYDLAYVRHFSIWLDLKILLATLATCGGRRSVPASWLLRNHGQAFAGANTCDSRPVT